MQKVILIPTETVGLAFQQALAAQYAQKSKHKRRAEYNRLKRALLAMRLVPTTMEVQALGWGIDRNGHTHVLVTGEIHDDQKL